MSLVKFISGCFHGILHENRVRFNFANFNHILIFSHNLFFEKLVCFYAHLLRVLRKQGSLMIPVQGLLMMHIPLFLTALILLHKLGHVSLMVVSMLHLLVWDRFYTRYKIGVSNDSTNRLFGYICALMRRD